MVLVAATVRFDDIGARGLCRWMTQLRRGSLLEEVIMGTNAGGSHGKTAADSSPTVHKILRLGFQFR